MCRHRSEGRVASVPLPNGLSTVDPVRTRGGEEEEQQQHCKLSKTRMSDEAASGFWLSSLELNFRPCKEPRVGHCHFCLQIKHLKTLTIGMNVRNNVQNLLRTRMRSSRMHSVRCSGRRGGG